MSTVHGLLIDVSTNPGKVSEAEIDSENIQTIYDILKCDTFDIATRMIGGKSFSIVCDDEGLLKDNPQMSAFDSEENPVLVGNLFVCSRKDSELSSLPKEDILHVLKNIAVCVVADGDSRIVHPVLYNVEYACLK